jgi:membrane protein required for colicin V production
MEIVETYNIIDLFVVGTLASAMILGLWKGLIRTLTALASLVLGVVLSIRYYPSVEPYLRQVSSLDPHISMALSVALVFIGVQITFVIIRRILESIVDLTRLTWLDRALGGAMGATAGFLVVAAVVQAIITGAPEWDLAKKSKLAPAVVKLTGKVMQIMPQSAHAQIETIMKKWKGAQESTQRPALRNMAGRATPGTPPEVAR